MKRVSVVHKLISVILVNAMLLAGCAGREPNPVKINQPGDDQKSCETLRIEMQHNDNEVTRLLPNSDKSGSNLVLLIAGLFVIVPFFFMDLKQGERKEIEALRERNNRLFMITQMKDCKIKPAIQAVENDSDN